MKTGNFLAFYVQVLHPHRQRGGGRPQKPAPALWRAGFSRRGALAPPAAVPSTVGVGFRPCSGSPDPPRFTFAVRRERASHFSCKTVRQDTLASRAEISGVRFGPSLAQGNPRGT